ncbi:hypothetical protein ACQPVP_13015 [Clostridium nigeriense]|uniref:hypothetical protein n=1 Tax=Clostridium nigeriense TaxID=1805470 RepID=UPI003D329783
MSKNETRLSIKSIIEKKLGELYNNEFIENSKSNYTEELILFVSFDLVNSSSYKTRNYTSWFPILITITEKIKESMIKKIDKSQLWRTIGDEAVFIVNIANIEQLENSIKSVFEILNNIVNEIKNGEILDGNFNEEEKEMFVAQNVLSLKAAAWIAPVHKTKDLKIQTNKIHNLMYIYNHNGDEGLPTYEFQGNDIDTGFRIAKNTIQRRLTLSLELAYLLSKNQFIDNKIHIVAYRKLKGIWDGKMYPIIWYHDHEYTNCKLEDSFFYDEYYNDDITKEFIDKEFDKMIFEDNMTSFQKINKIVKDKNIKSKIDIINKILNQSTDSKKLLEGNKLLEVHCVAVCVNLSRKEVLMFKRSKDTDLFQEKWDFGCCEMQNGQSFKSNIEKDYKKKFNINIKVGDPIKEYNFLNENKKNVPGIRFIAEIIDDSNIKFDTDEYIDKKYISLDEFRRLNDQEQDKYISYSEFLDVFESVEKKINV